MRTSELITLCMLAGATVCAEGPDLGTPVIEAEIAAIDLTIMPDGTRLPDGSGTARAGALVYARHCAACHGAGGEGGPNDRLVGGHGSLTSDRPIRTVGSFWPYATTIFDYVRRAMPYQTPGALNADDLYAVTAYVLHLNGIVDEDEVMDARSLPKVEMPNRTGFVWGYEARAQ